MDVQVIVVGAGLAGSECSWQLSRRGIKVLLIEMRPDTLTPAHHTGGMAELVCSNSLRSNDPFNAVGLLKEEMSSLESIVMRAAYAARVPAGTALAVDRQNFSTFIEQKLCEQQSLSRVSGVVKSIEKHQGRVRVILENNQETYLAEHCVIATGPLTHDVLAEWIKSQTNHDSLYFYDSIAPIIDAESIDRSIAFKAARYGRGDDAEGDYINCPLTQTEYESFIDDILAAELVAVHDFDKAQFFEGCLPVEEMARRGRETLRFGPMKPVGLTDPRHPGAEPHAVVQLRQDNAHASLYNMVGFQTRMKWPEQKRIFSKIPGLEKAVFERMGSMHRNTYLCSPRELTEGLSLKSFPQVHFAGQITGCEGYIESAAVGLFLGLWLSQLLLRGETLVLPAATFSLAALIGHLLNGDPNHYQPMNINFGLFEPLEDRPRKKSDKKMDVLRRAQADFRRWYYDSLI